MLPSLNWSRAARSISLALVVWLVSACGGGSQVEGEAAALPTQSRADSAGLSQLTPNKQRQSATVNADGPTNALVIRAHGVLAGDVGPMLQLWANGSLIDTVEVRATTPTDYRFTVPALQPGTKVDVVFTNDGTVGTANRDLIVTHLAAGKTLVLPTAPGTSYDRGVGAAAFDGLDVISGRSALSWGGALRLTWPEPNLTEQITVRASSTLLDNTGALMALRVDGILVGTAEVRSTTPADFTFAVPAFTAASRIDVVHTNHASANGVGRNLQVHYLRSGNTVLLPTASGNIFDLGSGPAAFDGQNTLPAQATLNANGALRGRWPALNMTDTLTVRASGRAAGGVAPTMQVLVDGVLLGSATVTTTPSDFSFATLPMKPGSQVQVLFANPGTAGSDTRSLKVAYAMAGKTYLLAANDSIDATWPEPNLTDTLTVRAKGTLAGDVGPMMQVLVDGIVLGSTEVRSAGFADFSFAAPAMAPGRKVDVALTNATEAATNPNRSLEVAYLAAGKTTLLPNAAGNLIDRGAGAAAFDGVDTIAGQGQMPWPAALRTTWPQPNITSTVTVRASGTLAGNVGPVMRLWVDGVAVSSVEVRATTPTDYTLPTPTLRPGSRIDVTFENPATVDGVPRQLNLAYLLAGATVLKPTASGAVYSAGNLQATWPSVNLTDTLTVRAHGVVAGDVGPILQVLVDGVLVGSTEVRASAPTEHQFTVPAMRPGTRVDLLYANDSTVGGVDRNLFIQQVMSGRTAMLPTATGNTVDRGIGAAAFDGLDVIPGQGALVWNGALRMTWPAPNLTEQITVRASSRLLDGTGALMALRVDGIVVGTTEVRSTAPVDFSFAVPALTADSRIDVIHTNHASAGGVDRSLQVHYLRAGNAVLLPGAAGNIFDLGSGLAAFDGQNTLPAQATLNANGALRGRWPALNMTDTITVRASGRAAGGVAPTMQVLVDGVVLGSATVTTTTPSDFSFPTLPVKPGSQVQVLFSNPGTAGTETRSLNVAYAIAGKTYLLATSGSLNAPWPEPNLTDRLTVRAKGTLAGNVGPIMQVLVDGIQVGAAEVRSTDFADFSFAAPAMTPSRKIDVVYANDANVSGVDRNLYLAYLIAGNTFLLPNAPGTTYDRGAGPAAFDGIDVVQGQSAIESNGALRGSWPAPNITGTLTVRASGTLAGNVGPLMQVRVDGVIVSSVEVRSTQPADYLMPVPAVVPGSKIDIIFANDAVVEGVDRNLNVAYVMAGKTVVTPSMPTVRYDLGFGNDAFNDVDVLPGQSALGLSGALRFSWPVENLTETIAIRARASLLANVGALMQVRVDGVIVGQAQVNSTTGQDYVFNTPKMSTGSRLDIVFVNDQSTATEDRNLFVQYIRTSNGTLVPTGRNATWDAGTGEAAVDGMNTAPGNTTLSTNGALRFTIPAPTVLAAQQAARYAASRFLQQATFGATVEQIDALAASNFSAWINQQISTPVAKNFVSAVQVKFDLGDAYRVNGTRYTPIWVGQRFWETAATSPDQLRKRTAFALHHLFMVSQTDSSLFAYARSYARYLDILNENAFGNYRKLLEEIALSPAMGIYLSHMRNRREDPATGRMPDENFAREVMQLFTIGLYELNLDGTLVRDSQGSPIETYSNDDVMALARVFTGWSWGFPENELTDTNFRIGRPDTTMANDRKLDLQPMKAYPGQHSLLEKKLFANKPHALTIPAGTPATESVRLALDALFRHPNVGPFVARQLIQRFVTSHPSGSYVARVAAVFNNNGAGVRGDLGAVVRAILLDPDAMTPPIGSIGKLREPVLRVAHWMRSFEARSTSGEFMMAYEGESQGQRALYAPSVFGYFRPGFVPANTAFSANSITVPEMQIVSESSTAHWVNLAQTMAGGGLGWNGAVADVVANLQPLADLAAAGDVDGLIERLNLLLFAGGMSASLKQDMLDSVTSVGGNDAGSQLNRAKVALFLALASPEYTVQK